jgi:hypothetical protein
VGADLVQEVPIVADDDHRGVVVVQDALEPVDGMDVQVVGGLIQQQHIGLGEQRLCQQHAQLEARSNFTHGAEVQLSGDSGISENGGGARLRGVAVVLGESGLELGGFHVVGIGGVRIGINPVAFGHGRPHFAMALHDDVDDALVFVAELVLVQFAQAQAVLQGDIPDALLELAAQDLHERGLAAAVGPDQAIAVAVRKLDGDPLKKRLRTKLNRNVRGNQHLFCPATVSCAAKWPQPIE